MHIFIMVPFGGSYFIFVFPQYHIIVWGLTSKQNSIYEIRSSNTETLQNLYFVSIKITINNMNLSNRRISLNQSVKIKKNYKTSSFV